MHNVKQYKRDQRRADRKARHKLLIRQERLIRRELAS